MASKPYVEMTFGGDPSGLQKAMEKVGAASKDMSGDLDRSAAQARSFGQSMDRAGDAMDTSEGKFMATADLLDGLGGAFGLPIDNAVGMARSFGDLASGLKGAVIPAVQSMWAVLAANPIAATIAAIVAIGAALVIAYQKSETFRDIVNGAFNAIKDVVGTVANAVRVAWDFAFKAIKTAAEIYLTPLRLIIEGIGLGFEVAKDLVAAAWRVMKDIFEKIKKAADAALGPVDELIGGAAKLGGDVLKGVGKILPFAEGGIVTRPTLGLVGEAGPEAIIPLDKAGGIGGTTVVVHIGGSVVSERQLVDVVHSGLLQKQRRSGNLGLAGA